MRRYDKKMQVYFSFAAELASLSTCKRAKVGAVVVSPGLSQIHSIGYNGPPKGQPNAGCKNEEGSCGCVHAEANAIAKLDVRIAKPALMLCTTLPCPMCASLIANCGAITDVLYLNEYRIDEGLQILEGAGIIPWHWQVGVIDDVKVQEWRTTCSVI